MIGWLTKPIYATRSVLKMTMNLLMMKPLGLLKIGVEVSCFNENTLKTVTGVKKLIQFE